MRGKLLVVSWGAESERNIPAYAGKTTVSFHTPPVAPEHPRVCGENGDWGYAGVAELGTSPRMRGKHTFLSTYIVAMRNIPAYAGKTPQDSPTVGRD